MMTAPGAGVGKATVGDADPGTRGGHHDLHAASRASGMPAASCADYGWIGSHLHPFGKPAGDFGGDVDRERAEVDEASVPGQWPVALWNHGLPLIGPFIPIHCKYASSKECFARFLQIIRLPEL